MDEHYACSVVIPCFNQWNMTVQCLQNLSRTRSDEAFEVIVIDNGSSDDTSSSLNVLGDSLFGRHFHGYRFEENRNFGPACNYGVKKAKADLVFLLNNDTIPTSHWLPPLLNQLQNTPRRLGTGPLLLYPNNTVQHLGIAFSLLHVSHLYQNFPATHPFVHKERTFQAITAAALLLRKKPFLEENGFFEGYANGYEDVDLCLRLAAKGWHFSVEPKSVVYHLESQSAGRKNHDAENGRLLQERCKGLYKVDLHIHGFRDGLEPFVNDFFEIGLRNREEESKAFFQKMEGMGEEEMRLFCFNNPLWLQGKKFLARRAEERHDYSFAISMWAQTAFLSKEEKDFEALFALEDYALEKDMGILRGAYAEWERMKLYKKNTSLIRRKLSLLKYIRDPFLQKMYRLKISKEDLS